MAPLSQRNTVGRIERLDLLLQRPTRSLCSLLVALVVIAVAFLHTEALSTETLQSLSQSKHHHHHHHHQWTLGPAVRSQPHNTSSLLRRNNHRNQTTTISPPVWLPLQLQKIVAYGVHAKSSAGEGHISSSSASSSSSSDKPETNHRQQQEQTTHDVPPAELAIAAVFHETNSTTTPGPPARTTTAAMLYDDFASNFAKLREQRVADEQRRIRGKMGSRGSEKDRFERGDVENAKAAAQAAKTLSGMQAETARQRKVIQHALAGLPEEQQPEPHNPDLDVASLKANAIAGFAKTGGVTPLVAQVLADL